jgi:O-antigen/teichoic acid export membrane protein
MKDSIKKFYKRLFKSEIAKNISMIAGGTAFAQFLSFLLTPVITRLYSPEEYGYLTLFISVLGILTIFMTLKYEVAIPIEKEDKKAINLLILNIIILFILSFFIVIIFLFSGKTILNWLDAAPLMKYWYLIPIGFVLQGFYNIFNQWSIRKKRFKSISVTKISQSSLGNISKIIFGFFKFGPVGLITGQIIGQSAGIMTLTKPFVKEDKYLISNINIKNIKEMALRYIYYPLYVLPNGFLGTGSEKIPFIFIGSIYGASALGHFGLANSIVNLPMTLIGTSVSNVFLGEVAKFGREDPERVKNLTKKLLKRVFIIGSIPTIILIFFGPFLFSFVFGENWKLAGEFSRIISIAVLSKLVFTPISNVFLIYEKYRASLFLNIFRMSSIFLLFLLADYFKYKVTTTLIIYTIIQSFVFFMTFLISQIIINKEIDKKSSE